ncbi:RidA family protein [Putridiphycobacter roseus]|uniref:RidA family protein n=1 Tax=Putridiphycobacter roseus TaxID=2219161 RepID=A0A2W1NIQ3_9FLAO|nr:RidA family protein [Putridiphycobacter roseus]PZE17826.1 RidA family protein [Putridiphycobacter roseus]
MKKEIIQTADAPAAIGPYSQAIKVNGVLYSSGQIAINPNSGLLEIDDIDLETKRVMLNLKAVLKAAGLEFSDVVKVSIFLKNMDDFDRVNQVYATFFTENYPARETVQVAKLPRDVNVEISIVAFAA